jgi:uncharacterized protein
MAASPKPGLLRALGDGLANAISGVGTRADRRRHSRYIMVPVDQAEVEASYRGGWLGRKVHDLPPFDMTRAGRNWQAKKEQIDLLEAEERRLAVWPKLRRALILARLYGGAALILGVGDAAPEAPLPANIGKAGLKYLNVVSRHQLSFPDGLETDPTSEFYGQPRFWQMQGGRLSVKIHPSRVIPFVGQPLPEGALITTHEFWGDPLLQIIKDAIANADTAQGGIAALIDEAKIDTLSIPGLTELVSTAAGEQRLTNRINVANAAKSTLNTRIIDKEEEWDTRQINFAGLPDIIETYLQIVAAATDIPVTRLLGTSAKGLNATGEGDNDNYDEMIRARQKMDLGPCIDRLDALLIPSALGATPADIYYEFAPLEEPDPKENAAIEKSRAETVKIYADAGVVPDVALAKATQNAMVESGQWPGLDAALAEAEAAGDIAPIMEEPAEPDPAAVPQAGQNPANPPRRRAANDAAPRTLYVSRKVINAAEVIRWAKAQGFKTTLAANDLHVTVAFSRTPVDWLTVGTTWSGEKDGKLTVSPGGARIVEPLGDKGAVVLLFSASELSWRHEEIKRAGASFDYDQYQPHITISYDAGDLDLSTVEPYRGQIVLGPEIFEEVKEDWEQGITEA